jgi:signal transduction histidine kinase
VRWRLPPLEAYQQFHSVKESVFNETSNLTLRNLEVRYGTQQALAEMERLKQMHEEDQRYYESLNQLQQELIGAASHDLRSPLNSIMLALELLELRQPDR